MIKKIRCGAGGSLIHTFFEQNQTISFSINH